MPRPRGSMRRPRSTRPLCSSGRTVTKRPPSAISPQRWASRPRANTTLRRQTRGLGTRARTTRRARLSRPRGAYRTSRAAARRDRRVLRRGLQAFRERSASQGMPHRQFDERTYAARGRGHFPPLARVMERPLEWLVYSEISLTVNMRLSAFADVHRSTFGRLFNEGDRPFVSP